MKAKALRLPILALWIGLALFTAGCNSACGPAATDYSRTDRWVSLPARVDKGVDVFYLYPTAWQKAGPSDPNICNIDNASMKTGAPGVFALQATAFETVGNIYAPYYRQADAAYLLSLRPEDRDKAIGGIPKSDVMAAFDYYIEHYNGGRPFILAGHSQGSMVLMYLLSDYMKEHPQVYARMIVAYVIGYSVTQDYLTRNPHLRFAEGPDDTGVIVSYNTQAPNVSANGNPVVLPGAIAINPISWTREETLAPATEGMGSFMPDARGAFRKAPQYADARVDKAKGAVITTADSRGLSLGFGAGIYHVYDYLFYYFNLRENAANRAEHFRLSQPP
jgi:pimeloyl-ACP methyl ester carboxylesterase